MSSACWWKVTRPICTSLTLQGCKYFLFESILGGSRQTRSQNRLAVKLRKCLADDWTSSESRLARGRFSACVFPPRENHVKRGGMCFLEFLFTLKHFLFLRHGLQLQVLSEGCSRVNCCMADDVVDHNNFRFQRGSRKYIKKKETSEQPGLSPKDASTCRQEEVELTLPHKPWHWIMFPRSSRSFSSDFKLLYGVISVFYVQSQVLRPPFFYDLIPDHAPPGVRRNLVSLFLSSRANGKKKRNLFELQIPHCSVSLADRNHDLTFSSSTQQRKGLFFFSSHALDARTCRHTHPSAWISINCSRTM